MKRLLFLFILLPWLCFAGSTSHVNIAFVESGGGGNTISLVSPNGTESATVTGSRDLVTDVPTGVSDGDLMYAGIINDVDILIEEPSGWTQAGSQASSSSSRLGLFYRVASSEPASYTWTFTGGSPNTFSGVIVAFEKTGGTWDAVQSTNDSSGSGTSLATGSVTTTDDSFHIAIFGSDDTVTQGSVPSMTNAIFESPVSLAVGLWYESITTGSAITRTWTTTETGDKTSVNTVLEAE